MSFISYFNPCDYNHLCIATSASEIMPHIFCRIVLRSQSMKLKECGGDALVFYSYFPIVGVYITMEEVLRVYKRPYIEKEQDFPPTSAISGSRLATKT